MSNNVKATIFEQATGTDRWILPTVTSEIECLVQTIDVNELTKRSPLKLVLSKRACKAHVPIYCDIDLLDYHLVHILKRKPDDQFTGLVGFTLYQLIGNDANVNIGLVVNVSVKEVRFYLHRVTLKSGLDWGTYKNVYQASSPKAEPNPNNGFRPFGLTPSAHSQQVATANIVQSSVADQLAMQVVRAASETQFPNQTIKLVIVELLKHI